MIVYPNSPKIARNSLSKREIWEKNNLVLTLANLKSSILQRVKMLNLCRIKTTKTHMSYVKAVYKK